MTPAEQRLRWMLDGPIDDATLRMVVLAVESAAALRASADLCPDLAQLQSDAADADALARELLREIGIFAADHAWSRLAAPLPA